MPTLELLSRRMATLQSIHNVVRTMKTLSAVNAAPYERATTSISAFHETVLRGLSVVLRQTELPLQATATDSLPQILLIFGSDHGLCGGYNEALAEEARTITAAETFQQGTVFVVGARMAVALDSLGIAVEKCFTPPASVDGIGKLASEILITLDTLRERTRDGDIALKTVHMQSSHSHGLQTPFTNDLLPINSEFLNDIKLRPWQSRSLPTFSMPAKSLFATLIRNHLFASIFRATAEAMAAENAARLALMQQAERSIEDRLAELLSTTRSARQTEITNELLDVIAGFEALKA